ncbi:hypothetical protein [Frateuria defendens]|uniref:hypothetical protein n=1 Tax=Frateuria defendens TaxID=2219559 RepID=UPI00066FC6C6|nr:hypothetical protein [Frateuria defendens]
MDLPPPVFPPLTADSTLLALGLLMTGRRREAPRTLHVVQTRAGRLVAAPASKEALVSRAADAATGCTQDHVPRADEGDDIDAPPPGGGTPTGMAGRAGTEHAASWRQRGR